MVKIFMKLKLIGKILVIAEVLMLYLMYSKHNIFYIFPYMALASFNTWSFIESNKDSHEKETAIFLAVQVVAVIIVYLSIEYLTR